ncbi:MAG: helix-turn-helix transcriptional regulator [Sandaracinus sp.]|nr:helix-turn-helix transcriptional regulator [Sandaracinus sp.]MCB9619287.1 helix-turn-helix transcriptional regulator [Sandaracinus sp.]
MDHEGKATEAVAPGVGTPQAPAPLAGGSVAGGTAAVPTAVSSPREGRGESSSSSSASSSAIPSSSSSTSTPDEPKRKAKARPRPPAANHLRKYREELCLSQAELARRANLSALTVARIEQGYGCRMSTKRKILEALGLSLADRKKVFGEEE